MAGKGGGAWKVAYADFVTAMMAFFMVMWIVALSQPVRQAIAEYFRYPWGRDGAAVSSHKQSDGGGSRLFIKPFDSAKPSAAAPPGTAPNNTPHHGTAVNNRVASVAANTTVGKEIVFTGDSADLGDAARADLEEILPALVGKANRIEIRGHAALRLPSGANSTKNPWELSFARSMAVMQQLVAMGVDARRIRLSEGGSNDPKYDADSHKLLASSGRVEIFVLPEFVATPWDDDDHRDAKRKPGSKRKVLIGKQDPTDAAGEASDSQPRDATERPASESPSLEIKERTPANLSE